MVKIPVLNHRFLISGTQLARTWSWDGSVQTVSWKIIISVAVAWYSEIIVLFGNSCKKASISKKQHLFHDSAWILQYMDHLVQLCIQAHTTIPTLGWFHQLPLTAEKWIVEQKWPTINTAYYLWWKLLHFCGLIRNCESFLVKFCMRILSKLVKANNCELCFVESR